MGQRPAGQELGLRAREGWPRSMPGPWIHSKDNPNFLVNRTWQVGDLYESTVYDPAKKEQKRALWMTTEVEGKDEKGRWLRSQLIAVEDKDLHWWLTKGPGAIYHRDFKVHVCSGDFGKCKAHNGRARDEFHVDFVRTIEYEDLRLRKVAWWLVHPAKNDFEAFRKDAAAGTPSPKKPGAEEEALDLSFDPDDVPGGSPEVERKAKAKDLEKQLAELKRQGLKDVDEKAKKDKARDKEKVKKKPRASESSTREKGRKVKERAPEWFGRQKKSRSPVPEKERRSRDKSRSKKRKRSSSALRGRSKKEKRKAKVDRGPYGVGEKMSFGGVDYISSGTTSEEEEDFHGGASDKRSHQLRLVEYAQKRPGRLTSRLLMKKNATDVVPRHRSSLQSSREPSNNDATSSNPIPLDHFGSDPKRQDRHQADERDEDSRRSDRRTGERKYGDSVRHHAPEAESARTPIERRRVAKSPISRAHSSGRRRSRREERADHGSPGAGARSKDGDSISNREEIGVKKEKGKEIKINEEKVEARKAERDKTGTKPKATCRASLQQHES